MELKCPKCERVVASRRNVLCAFCGERLPEELLFSAEERAQVEKELDEAKRRAKEAMRVPWPESGPS
jgi:hypothetical protein